MLRALLYFLLIYLAYRFIFNFLVPVFKTTQQIKKGFRDMQNKMNNHMEENNVSQSSNDITKKPSGDYIDFEEIK